MDRRGGYVRQFRVGNENAPLLSSKASPNARGAFWTIVVLGAVMAAVALGLAIWAVTQSGTPQPIDQDYLLQKHVNHGNVPDIGDKWLYRGRDLENSAHAAKSQITSNNVHTLVEAFKAQIGQDPSLGGTIAGAVRADINWGSVTVDEENIYLATHNQRNEAGTTLFPGGYLMAFNRATGARIWNKAVASYSMDNAGAQFGSKFEMAPAVHGDYLYIGSKNNAPQTWVSPPHQTITNPTFFGFPNGGKQRRTHVYCINKHTGAEVWAKELGAVATDFASPDNLLFLSMSPIVFEMDPTGGTNKIPVVAIGTSSGNSFVPAFSSSDEVKAKRYADLTFGFGNLGTDPNTRLTDVGRLILLNGNTGDVISTSMMGPTLYQAGDLLTDQSVVYGDNTENFDMEIWHIVQAADIAASGELNPVIPRYSRSKMTISMLPNATIVAASPLVGLSVVDNDGDNHIIAAGVVPSNLNFVTVTMEVEFVPGTTDFFRVSPQAAAAAFDTATADLDGAAGNTPARIVKQLKIGDNLTAQDAYECNYYGASIWGSNPSINYNQHGIPTELYFATGQAHKIPYDETKRFANPKPPSPFASPVERQFNIKQKQNAFAAAATQTNLDAVRQANKDRLKDLDLSRKEPVSVRSRRFHHNSVVAINLRPGHVGEIIWTEKTLGYDTWRIDLLNDQQRQSEGGPIAGFTDAEAHYGMLRGHDGDHGESPYYCPNCGQSGGDYIVAPTKAGSVIALMLTDVNDGPTTAWPKPINLLGNPGLLGGSNYGSTLDKKTRRLYTVQSNEAAAFQTTVDRRFNKRSLPPPMEWYPAQQTDPALVMPLPHRQSYLSCYNFLEGKIEYEVPLLTTPPGSERATVTAFSSGADLIYVQPNSLTLQIRKASDGTLVHSIALDSAGVSNAAVLNRELIIANGREGFLGQPAGSDYKGAKYVYKFALP